MTPLLTPAGDPTRLEHGHCFCGAIRAEMRGEPFWICYDHDDDCRRAIGSPLTIWVGYRPEQFLLTAGNPKAFSRTPGVTRSFCADCGSSIAYEDQGLPDELYVCIGFMDAPQRFPPQAHGYWEKRLPYVEMSDGLPRTATYTRSRSPEFGNPNDRSRRRARP